MKKTQDYTIGQLARDSGVNIETVRYYERRGLIAQPVKPKQGYRTYPQATLNRMLFIKRAQELGFTLDEIANLLSLSETPCREAQKIAAHKLAAVRARVADLRRLEAVLDNLLMQCQTNPDQASCPIIESLLPEQR